MKNSKGITLTSLIITIIVMVILVGISLVLSTGEDGIIERANKAKYKSELAEFKEKIGIEYLDLKNDENNKDKLARDLFEELRDKLQLKERFIGNESFIIKYDEETDITLLEDGTIIDGRKAVLNIADGTIDIKSNGFVQGERELQTPGNYRVNGKLNEYIGDYVITGTSDKNVVRVMEKGTYNITIRDLNIQNDEICAFNANRSIIGKGVFVNLYIEGDNYLYGYRSGLGFGGATPNINGETDGSTLTIQGEGSLYAKGGQYSAGIGCGYTGFDGAHGDANNIIINSGNITAVGGHNACGIGGARYKNVNNIIINGGNINATSPYGKAIGAYEGILNNLIINGGNIISYTNSNGSGGVIGGNQGSGNIVINGGLLNIEDNSRNSRNCAALGNGSKEVIINGGEINLYSSEGIGIGYNVLPFKLEKNGGEISVDDRICSMPVNLSNGKWYLIKFKIGELAKETKIDNVQINNNVEYETQNLYTSRDGHLYMFLPEGEVTVSIIAGGKTYSGTVTVTSENTEVFILN